MDVEQMKADLGPGAVFDIGEENTAFAQYFTGEGGSNEWLEPVDEEEYKALK